MGFQVITLTDAAANRINEITGNAGPDALGIRISIKKGGCAGFEYAVDLVTRDNTKAGDDTVEHAGAKVWVDPAASLYLLGTEMDFEVTKLRTGFVFRNPNETSACGCGESVELKAADLAELARAREAAAH
ncbi:MAG: Fe-S cluster assembly scaffold SufA [Martelella sp.]